MEIIQDNMPSASSLDIAIVAELPGDVAARDRLLDRAMGPRWRKKASEKLRRGRKPSEGLAFVARGADGRVVGTVRLWDVGFARCEGMAPLTPPHNGEAVASAAESPSPSRGGVRGGGDIATLCGTRALLLGPLAVDPEVKSAGIGSALMRHAIEEARRLGHRAILLVGDPEYYQRFGFDSAKTAQLAMPGPFEKRRLLALEIEDGALDGAAGVLKPAGRKLAAAPTSLAA